VSTAGQRRGVSEISRIEMEWRARWRTRWTRTAGWIPGGCCRAYVLVVRRTALRACSPWALHHQPGCSAHPEQRAKRASVEGRARDVVL